MPVFTVGTYDVGADNEKNLLAAINAQNGTTYTLDDYHFTEPKRVTIPTPMYNSSIKLGPRAATGMIGFKTIYYNRIHVSDIGPLLITWQNEQFLTELLPRLSEKYGISLTSKDLFEQRIVPPVAPETEVSITLNFKETSVAYYGGSVVVLGLLDPALEFETPQTMPFKNDLVFYVNNFTKTKQGENYLESSVLSIASDKLRSRTMDASKLEDLSYASIIRQTYTNAQRAKLEQYLPFVFTWMLGDTKTIRGVTIYGDILEINETTNLLEKKSSLVTVDPLVSVDLAIARDKILVREGTQDRLGNLYILVGKPAASSVSLMTSDDDGLSWSEITVNKTNRASFNYANWGDVVINDLVVEGNKLSILVSSPLSYGVHPGKSAIGPAVEEFDLVLGTSDFFPLTADFVTNTKFGLTFNSSSKLRFVSSELPQGIMDVVGIARTSKTLDAVAVYFHREPGQEYTEEVLGSRFMNYPVYGISAHAKPLVKDPSGSFVSIEILSMVDVSRKDDFFLVQTNQRSENSFLGYGVICMSGTRKGDELGGWSENTLGLGDGSSPTNVTVTDKGKRNHYIFSGGDGIYNVQYSETAPNIYTPTLNRVFDVGSHSGFDLECDVGNGKYQPVVVNENPAFAAVYNSYPDEESIKLPIGYSFLVKNRVTNKTLWLTSPDTATPLTERTFGAEYKHLGSSPVAVFSDSTGKLYAWTKNQGVYSSADQGNSWSDYSTVKSYYSSSDYLGRANITLKPNDFKALTVLGGITYAELSVARSLTVMNLKTHNPAYALELKDRVIYRLNALKPTGEVPMNSASLTTDLNSTSDFSPRQVVGWDTDINNNIRVLTKYVEGGVASKLNQLDIPQLVADDATDVYCDTGFLGLKAIAITKSDTDGANLKFVKNDDSVVRHGLKFSTTPEFANFDPLAIVPLWDGSDAVISYTPIMVTSLSKEILIIERDGLAGNPATIHFLSLIIPGDNTKPIAWLPMLNSNRRDVCFFQENNGIFKVVYAWDGALTKSVVTLEKLFSLTGMNVSEVYSGCAHNVPDVTAFSDSIIGPWPVAGTVLGTDCSGTTEREKLADGFGSYYWRVIKVQSENCGFVTPVVSNTGEGGGNFNVGP